MRDPFVYLFVNEGNETGNLIFGLCFPMAPIAVDGPLLELGEGGDDEGQASYRKDAGLRASWVPARYSWVGRQGAPPRDNRHALLLR